MEYDIFVPKFDEEGSVVTVIKWHKHAGDHIIKDEILAEVESDTASCDIISPVTGTLSVVYIPEGKTTRLGMQIASVKEDKTSEIPTKENTHKKIELQKKQLEEEMAEAAFTSKLFEKEEKKLEEETKIQDQKKAHKLAQAIVKNRPETDADSWQKIQKIKTPNDSVHELDFLISQIAEQRKKSKNNSIISTVINEIDMSEIISLTENFGKEFAEKYHVRLGFTPFIIKAVIAALKNFPMFNASIIDGEIIYKTNYDFSLTTKGFDSAISPIIRNADQKTIWQLEKEMLSLSERCENKELTLEESSGATFAFMNAGIFGSLLSSDPISYPYISSFSMHKVTQRAVVKNSQIVIRPMMYVSLSFDNRIANTKEASLLLERIKLLAENIGSLLLDL